jgi:probable phosphoglycerate mutase
VELLLIRHALPLRIENPDGTPADPPLSPEGRRQAERLVAWLADEAIDAVYTSPLRRARETAEPLARARGLCARLEPGVAEFDPLAASYVPLEEIKAENRELWRELVGGGLTAGVDVALFRRTVAAAIERSVAAHAGARVAIVCHGGVVNAWAAEVLGIEPTLFFQPAYTSVSRFLAAGSGERSILSLNETAHLRQPASGRVG